MRTNFYPLYDKEKARAVMSSAYENTRTRLELYRLARSLHFEELYAEILRRADSDIANYHKALDDYRWNLDNDVSPIKIRATRDRVKACYARLPSWYGRTHNPGKANRGLTSQEGAAWASKNRYSTRKKRKSGLRDGEGI